MWTAERGEVLREIPDLSAEDGHIQRLCKRWTSCPASQLQAAVGTRFALGFGEIPFYQALFA